MQTKFKFRIMSKEKVSFDELPQAVAYLTEKVEELSVMVSKLQPVQTPQERKPIEVDMACTILKKAKPTIYNLVRKGVLPAYKKGKKLYFYEDELLQWIETGRKETSQQTYDEMLATMQSGVRHKPKLLLNR